MVQINPYEVLSAIGQSTSDRNTIAGNFDTFLTLLTTQLKTQNPLEPLDTNQFTQQLVQFTGVEQAVKTNENLQALLQLSTAGALSSVVGYIGKEITAGGSNATLQNGSAQWTVTAQDASQAATFVVRNASGQEVYSQTSALSAGSSTFTWDGRLTGGGFAQPGEYTLSVQASDGNGGSLPVTTATSGIVEGVDMSGSEPVLIVSGREIRISDVTSVRMPGSTA